VWLGTNETMRTGHQISINLWQPNKREFKLILNSSFPRCAGLTFLILVLFFLFQVLLMSNEGYIPRRRCSRQSHPQTSRRCVTYLLMFAYMGINGITPVQSSNRATSFVNSFKRQGRIPAVVEYVAAGSRFKYEHPISLSRVRL